MGTAREIEESVDENEPIEPELQVTSSYSSSSGQSSGRSSRTAVEDEMEEESQSDAFLEEDDVDEEEDDEDMKVDKTDGLISDGEVEEQHNELLDGPIDTDARMLRFRQFSRNLGTKSTELPLKEPSQLTNRCHGMGLAGEVWSVLCHKDDLHSICNEKFMAAHKISNRPRKSTDPFLPEPRATLIDWMQDVCWAEKLHRETFHLAIDYADRVLSRGPAKGLLIQMHQLQLLGTTALFIAAKYEEIYPPKVDDIVSYTDRACTVGQVRGLEVIMLKVLEWELNVITPLHWTHLFLELLTGNSKPSSSSASSRVSLLNQPQEGFFYEDVPTELPVTTGICTRDDFMHVAYVMDMVILYSKCRKYSNRMLAAAVMYAVYDADEAIEQVTGLSLQDATVREAVEWLEPIVRFCEAHKVPVFKLPVVEGIRPDAIHTIQCHREAMMEHRMKRIEVVMEGIEDLRATLAKEKEKESRQRPAAIRLPQ